MNNVTRSKTRDKGHLVVGVWADGHPRMFARPFRVHAITVGMIVKVNGNYQRIYECGRRGLRYWCINGEVQAAIAIDNFVRRPALLPVGEAA